MPCAQKTQTRLVLDTNVVISGLLWRSHPRRLLDLAREGAVAVYTSGEHEHEGTTNDRGAGSRGESPYTH